MAEVKILQKHKEKVSVSRMLAAFCSDFLARESPRLLAERGQRMACFANDYVGIHVNCFGVYEKDCLEAIKSFLEPILGLCADEIAIDAGANIGNHTVFFAKLFKEVWAFEPHPDTYMLLRMNCRNLENVKTFQVALGDIESTLCLAENNTNMGASFISEDVSQACQIRVDVKRLDDIIGNIPVCFVKLDVEDFEIKVINGAAAMIARSQPVIVLEQRPHNFDAGEPEVIRKLRELGYVFCWHEYGVNSENMLIRRFWSLIDLIVGRTSKIVTSDVVPRNSYSMLIGVPPRFQGALLGVSPERRTP